MSKDNLALQNSNNLDVGNERIGRQIRDLRKAKSITLSSLAIATGRSVGYLSQVERGVSAITIPLLHTISEVLGVTISWFFHSDGEQPIDEMDHIVRADSRREIDFSGSGVHEELLSPTLSGELLMILSTFSPLSGTDLEQDRIKPRTRKGEEAGYIQRGRLILTIGEKEHILETGDSFCITGDEPHWVRNPSNDEDAVVVWVITPPNY